MQCAVHPEKNSVGYCKKCGKFGCEECLIKVLVTGKVGQQSRPTEALLCTECLGKIRGDTARAGQGKESSGTQRRAAQKRKKGIRVPRVVVVGAVAALVVCSIAAAATFLPRLNISRRFMTAEETAQKALEALAVGNADAFFSCVDVKGFMCRMDATGVTQRDYSQASGSRAAELEACHVELLESSFMVPDNLKKKFTVATEQVNGDVATVAVKPWIQFGNKLYKQVLLEKKTGEWKISGLAKPDL